MTKIVMERCSIIIWWGFTFCSLAIKKLKVVIRIRPQITLAIMALGRVKIRTGIIKVRAKKNLVRKVEAVAVQTSLVVWQFSDSSEMCMPKASDKASAMAMVKMPPITTKEEPVAESRPIIRPKVVITPEVRPKLKPFFIECFMNFFNNLFVS